jgi:AcrR family transcriptional regulator
LFESRGFERVSLSEIARAADVSIKTVVNHFGAKEELFFDAEPAVLDALLKAIRERGERSPTEALRGLILDGPILAGPLTWHEIADTQWQGMRTWSACEAESPMLTRGRAAILQVWATALASAYGSPAWGAMVAGLLGLRHAVLQSALANNSSTAEAYRQMREALLPGLDVLEAAFP